MPVAALPVAAFSPFAYGLPIAFALGVLTGFVGRAKGGSFFLWFAIGFVLPGFGLIAALLMRSDHAEPERRCPNCGAIQKLYVQVCTRCGEDLFLPDPAEVRPGRGA